MATIIWQKVYRNLSCPDAVWRAVEEASKEGYRAMYLLAAAQQTLFEEKDDVYVELHLEKIDAAHEGK